MTAAGLSKPPESASGNWYLSSLNCALESFFLTVDYDGRHKEPSLETTLGSNRIESGDSRQDNAEGSGRTLSVRVQVRVLVLLHMNRTKYKRAALLQLQVARRVL